MQHIRINQKWVNVVLQRAPLNKEWRWTPAQQCFGASEGHFRGGSSYAEAEPGFLPEGFCAGWFAGESSWGWCNCTSSHFVGIFHLPGWHWCERGPWKDWWIPGLQAIKIRRQVQRGENGVSWIKYSLTSLTWWALKYYLHKLWIHLQVLPSYLAGLDLLNLKFRCHK